MNILTVTAVFERNGNFTDRDGNMHIRLLFLTVRNGSTGEMLRDHLWLSRSKYFKRLCLKKGDKVEFRVVSAQVEKGYQGDYIERLVRDPQRYLPEPHIERTLVQVEHNQCRKI